MKFTRRTALFAPLATPALREQRSGWPGTPIYADREHPNVFRRSLREWEEANPMCTYIPFQMCAPSEWAALEISIDVNDVST